MEGFSLLRFQKSVLLGARVRGSEMIAVLFEILRSALAVEKYGSASTGLLLNPKPISKIC